MADVGPSVCGGGEAPRIESLAEVLAEDASRAPFAVQALVRLASSNSPAEAWWLDTLGALQTILSRDAALWTPEVTDALGDLYLELGQRPLPAARLLQVLAGARSESAIRRWSQCVIQQPPVDERHLGLAIGPLFQRLDYEPDWLFPEILEGLSHPMLASAVLDLANYLTRSGACPLHPAAERRESLAGLLGQVSQRLTQLEQSPPQTPEQATEIRGLVGAAVALGVSLCDALGLIGDPASAAKLNQALAPGHRRLRVEAAAALARLGDADGERILLELASEPVARLRVLAYAEELGRLDQVAAEHQSPVARAEGELAAWLSEPMQFGVAPGRLELLDERMLYWPGADDPEPCYLFRFEYGLGRHGYRNVGMSGPCVHAFQTDLSDTPIEDIYAAFAGWQCEHRDIYEVPAERFETAHHVEATRLVRRLNDERFEAIEPQLLGFFFGQRVLVAEARLDGRAVLAVADERDTHVHETRLRPEDAYCIYKGRQLLRSFNDAL